MAGMNLQLLRERVLERLTVMGKTPRAVSIEIGANQGYLRDLLDPEKGGTPSAARLQRLAEALATTTDYLMGLASTSAQPISEVSFGEAPPRGDRSRSDGIRVLGTAYCADLEVESATGEVVKIEQSLFEADHVVSLIERPPALRAAQDAYAIYFHGSSMEPRYYQGEIGIVDPRRPPGPGDFVVVQLCDGQSDDVVTVLVKQLVRTTSAYIELRQFNPDLSFRVPRGKVKRLHRIIGPNEAYGA